VRLLELRVAFTPNNAAAHRALGQAYVDQGREETGYAELVTALLLDPLDAITVTALGQLHLAAGAGLRIGSKPLLGGGVVRIDFAKPFERAPGEDRDWTVSVSVGQVFTF
jgi:hypothetical protein